MKALRIDHVVVATEDPEGATSTFRGHFELAPSGALAGGSPTLAIGGARIAFVAPAPGTAVASAFAAGGEGMAVVCLAVASLGDAASKLRAAGVGFATVDGGLEIDPAAAHGVRLRLVEHAGR